MNDKELQKNLLKKISKLRRLNDEVAESDIRRAVDVRLTEAFLLIRDGNTGAREPQNKRRRKTMKVETIYSQRDWLQDVHGDPLHADVCRPREFAVAPDGAWLDTSIGGWRSEISVSGRMVRLVYAGDATSAARWEII